jgi:NDP-hexose-3-ketoreductase
MYKYHPQFVALKRVVEEGALGTVKSLSIRFGLPALGIETFRNSLELGGGALLDLSCYPLSVAYELLAEPPALSSANVVVDTTGGVDTEGWAVLEGAGVRVDCEWGVARAYRNCLEVWGTEGLVVCDRAFTKEDDYDSILALFDQRGQKSAVVQTGRANAYRAMIESFAARLHEYQFFVAERAEAEWCALMTDRIRVFSSERAS